MKNVNSEDFVDTPGPARSLPSSETESDFLNLMFPSELFEKKLLMKQTIMPIGSNEEKMQLILDGVRF